MKFTKHDSLYLGADTLKGFTFKVVNLEKLLASKYFLLILSKNSCKCLFIHCFIQTLWGCSHGVMLKALDYGIVVSEFELQSHCYIHFRTNTLGKGMNPLIHPAMG